jgi:hypothetical protein
MVKITEKKSGMKIEAKKSRSGESVNIIITTPEGKIVDLTVWPDGGTLMHHAKDVTISQYNIKLHEIEHTQHTTVLNNC